MKASKGHGRGTSGKRGIGSGTSSYKTSSSKPATLKGYPKTDGTKGGKGGKKGC